MAKTNRFSGQYLHWPIVVRTAVDLVFDAGGGNAAAYLVEFIVPRPLINCGVAKIKLVFVHEQLQCIKAFIC